MIVMVGFTIRNTYTSQVYTVSGTLSQARNFCEQNLLRSSKGRVDFLSDLAAGLIMVYDARNGIYKGPGF